MIKRGKNFAAFGGVNVILLGIVSLLNDWSSEMILPILPLLITSVGGTGLMIGLIGGLIQGLPYLLNVFSGYLSDVLKKRKLFIFLGYLNSQVFKFLLVFASGWQSIMAFTSLDKVGKGIRDSPRDALIAESMPHEKGKAFGIQRAFDTTGAILGSIAVLIIVLIFGLVFKQIILIAALIGFVSLIPLYFLKEIDSNKQNPKKNKINFFRDAGKIPAKLWTFFLVAGIFALANFSYMFFVIKAAGESFQFANIQSFAVPILLYVLFNIAYAVFAIPFGKLSDEVGRRRVLLAGYFLFSLVCLGFLLFNSLTAFIILFLAYGLVYAIVIGVQRALVADHAPEELRATCLGLFQSILGVCAILSGVIAGLLFDINKNFTFIYGASLSFISAILFAFLFKKLQK